MSKMFISKNGKWVYLIWLALGGVIALPYISSMYFAVFSADDFYMAFPNWGVAEAIRIANEYYFRWSGSWPYMFMEIIMNPLQYGSSWGHTVGVFLIVTLFAFMLVLYALVRVVVKKMFDNTYQWLTEPIFCTTLFLFLNTDIYTEIYYWFVGNVYLWMFLFAALATIAMVFYFDEINNLKKGMVVSFLGFIACFGYMNAVALGMIYIILVSENFEKLKGDFIKAIYPLLFMIWGGCIAVFAPGNFKRHEVIDNTGLHFFSQAFEAIRNSFVVIAGLCHKRIFLLGVVLFFTFALFYAKKEIKIHPVIIWFAGYIAVFGVLYPLALGYSNGDIPNRELWVVNSVIILWTLYASLCSGAWVKNKINSMNAYLKLKKGLILFLIAISIMTFFSKDSNGELRIKTLPSVKIASQMDNIKMESLYERGIIKEIACSSDANVRVVRNKEDVPVRTGIIKTIGLTEDENYDVNQDVARWFGKESVVYIELD